MQGILYEESSFLFFAIITFGLGGATAWMTGRACAVTWRPTYVLFFYLVLLGGAVRFVHFAVFEGTLVSPLYFIVDTIVVLAIGFLAFRHTRRNQMVTQYYWLYEPSGALGWRSKS